MTNILYELFDIEKHKRQFKDTYLEIVISPTGRVEYAVPSHQQKLIQIACKKYNITEEQLSKMCPKEFYCDFNKWLSIITGYVCVWNNTNDGVVTYKQSQVLERLKREGLYFGSCRLTTFINVRKTGINTLNLSKITEVYKKYPKMLDDNEIIIEISTKLDQVVESRAKTYLVRGLTEAQIAGIHRVAIQY